MAYNYTGSQGRADKRTGRAMVVKKTLKLAIATVLFLLPLASFGGKPQANLAAQAAEDLHLREGISFYQDTDKGFPILASKIEDVEPETGRPTFIFFGASGDLNTNRQARRVVEIYKHFKDSRLKFVVIDVDHSPADPAKQILKNYYQGYIPAQVLLDKSGQKVWSANGEVDTRIIEGKIDSVL